MGSKLPPATALGPRYLAEVAALQRWLAAHAGMADELVPGFTKKGRSAVSFNWPEAVDVALCVGRIDGVRYRIDDERCKIRFTPRPLGSIWSAGNIACIALLPAGLAAFEQRSEKAVQRNSYARLAAGELALAQLAALSMQRAARQFFEAKAPSYRRKLIWCIGSTKQLATRERRLAALMAAWAKAERL